jgi:hypothetical protein
MHDTSTGNWDIARNVAIPTAAPAAQENYADREGRHADPSRKTASWVFSQAGEIEIRCRPEPGVVLSPVATLDRSLPRGDTAMACNAALGVKSIRIPGHFADQNGGGFFQKDHFGPRDYTLQASTGGFVVLLDDWGFAGEKEAPECPLQLNGGGECKNRGYWHMVKRAYERHVALEGNGLRPAGSALARHTVGATPIDENHFYLSYRGLTENQFADSVGVSHHDVKWDTTPWNFPSAYKRSKRDACWLGLECN